jgi:nitrilase
MESSTFVLHCTSIMTQTGIDAHATAGNPMFGLPGGGHSAVYAPDGRRLTKPLPADEEGFVCADLDMEMLVSMRHFADPVGHYSRPELLWLGVDSREKPHVRREGGDDNGVEKEGKTEKEEEKSKGLRKEVQELREMVEKLKQVSDARTQKESRLPRQGSLF